MSAMEVVMKATLISAQIKELEKTLIEALAVIKEAAVELQRLRGENEVLSVDNKIMHEQLRIVELRRNRAEFGKLPLLRAAE